VIVLYVHASVVIDFALVNRIDVSFLAAQSSCTKSICVPLPLFSFAIAQHLLVSMNNMSALEEALDILPLSISVDERAVKEAVITQLAQELCTVLRQSASGSAFNVSEDIMKQALASALIATQHKVISNPPSFVKIAKKYQRRASTPALSNLSTVSRLSNGVSDDPSMHKRAGTPEISSSNVSDPGSTMSAAGSLGVADFMNPEVLKTAKVWRFQKLSKAELVGLLEHHTQVPAPSSATKSHMIKLLMNHAARSI
jgi:hypothetical protein